MSVEPLPPGYTRPLVRRRSPWMHRTQLRVAVDQHDAAMPAQQHEGDAGLDLYTSTAIRVPSGQFRDVECGIRLELPPGYFGLIKGRSSTLRKRGLLVNEAVIDNGYIGPIYVGVHNLGEQAVEVAVGERVAQLILLPITRAVAIGVDGSELVSSDGRGRGGFGSTGV